MLTLQEAILLDLRYDPIVSNAEIQRVVDKFALRYAENNFEVQYALTGTASQTFTTSSGTHSITRSYNLAPTATLNGSWGTQYSVTSNNNVTHNDGGTGSHYNPGVTFSITQPLIQGFGPKVTLVPLYNAKDQELINRLTLKNTVIQQITTVINNYAALVQAQNTLKTQQLALQTATDTVKQTEQLIKAGRNAPSDLVQFEQTVASQRLSLQQQQTTVDQARYTLLQTLGLNPSTPIDVPQEIDFPKRTLPSLQECIDIALHNNPAYQSALIQLRISKRAVITAEDQARWQLDLQAQSTMGGGSGGGTNSGLMSLTNGLNKSTTVSLNLSVPINNVALKQAVVQAKISLRQAENTLAATQRQVISQITYDYNTLLNQEGQITVANNSAQLAATNLTLANAKLTYGKATSFEVSSLQTSLVSAQIALIDARITYLTTLATLDSDLGTTLDRWKVKIRY